MLQLKCLHCIVSNEEETFNNLVPRKCSRGTAVACFEELGRALVARGSLSKQNYEVIGKTFSIKMWALHYQ